MTGRYETLSVCLTKEDADWIRGEARRQGLSVSSFLAREICSRFDLDMPRMRAPRDGGEDEPDTPILVLGQDHLLERLKGGAR
jgi:hypothetical protein